MFSEAVISIFVTAAFCLFGVFRYVRAYRSEDERYAWLLRSGVYKPVSMFAAETSVVMFGFPPIFGAATAYLIYEQLGGEMSVPALYLFLFALVLGPVFLMKAFNKKKAQQFPSARPIVDESRVTSDLAVAAMFTRTTSPEKLKLAQRFVYIMLGLIILGLIVLSVMEFN